MIKPKKRKGADGDNGFVGVPHAKGNLGSPQKHSAKILAVSGGVDSMAMLHIFRNDPDAVVAHFNHGTRPSADMDEDFCRRYAAAYGRPFYSQKVTLGPSASEEKARSARYAFLSQLASDLHGEIYTAHHTDDLIESIAINILRGTGWRGLTPLSLHRHPFLDRLWSKADILRYASEHSIIFRQDPTNTEDTYLRNRLRRTLYGSDPTYRDRLISLWTEQKSIREQIETATVDIVPADTQAIPRSLFTALPPEVATELLSDFLRRQGISLTRPQLSDFLAAIQTYQPSKKFNLPNDRLVKIGKSTFSL